MQTLGAKNNVELVSQRSQSILRINTTILCRLTVDKMLKKYIYIFRSTRERLQDLKVIHSRRKTFFHESLHDLRRFTVEAKSSFLLTISAKQLIVHVVNKFIQNI